jgi:hypothetical protein
MKLYCRHTTRIKIKIGLWQCKECKKIGEFESFYSRGVLKILYKLSRKIQLFLFNHNIHWHNTIVDECTPTFSCCWHKMSADEKKLMNEIVIRTSIGEDVIYIENIEMED